MTEPLDAWPKGDLLEWWDDENRTYHDFFNETVRPYTAEENEAADLHAVDVERVANALLLRSAARDALAANRVFLATAAPTNAQTVAQVKALSRQVNALVRLTLGELSETD